MSNVGKADSENDNDARDSKSSYEGIIKPALAKGQISAYKEFSRSSSLSEAYSEDEALSKPRRSKLSPFLDWVFSKGFEFEDLFWLIPIVINPIRSSLAVMSIIGFLAGASIALAFPQIPLILGLGLLIPGMVGLLIGLEVAIVLNLLLRNKNSMEESTRRALMWFAILLAPVSIVALAFTLALGVAPGLLFIAGPAGWITLGVISAVVGLVALGGVFALAGEGSEFIQGLGEFFKGPGLANQESPDKRLEESQLSDLASSESFAHIREFEEEDPSLKYEKEISFSHSAEEDNTQDDDPESTNSTNSTPSSPISD